MTQRPLSFLLLPLVAFAAFFALTWPVWTWLWGEWMANEYYSHGILILPVSLFLVIQRFRNDSTLPWPPQNGSNRGLLLLVPAVAAYLFFMHDRAYYLAALAMIALIGGLVWTLMGDLTVRRLMFPIAYLIFMVPLPFIERSTLPLAMFTGVCSGGLVQFFGLDVTIVGNAVTLPNANLIIGAQCSGINSLISLLALTTLAAYLLEGPFWGARFWCWRLFPCRRRQHPACGHAAGGGAPLGCGRGLHVLSRLFRPGLLRVGLAAAGAAGAAAAHRHTASPSHLMACRRALRVQEWRCGLACPLHGVYNQA
ncbi:MAG: exosortase/archaeosortase family protein [Caldilineaceae bacterium]